MEEHPGGDEILLQYGGKDVTHILQDPNEHVHSDVAYEMLADYCIGTCQSKTSMATESKKVKDNSPFIDTSKPMLSQVWSGNFSKEFYLKQVHVPRHTKGSPLIFGSPYLEVFSKTPWWVIPIFWTPIISYCLMKSMDQNSALFTAVLFVLGVFSWTFIEYSLHRFLFHLDDLVPDHRAFITLHFLLHGVHHFLPMDRYEE